MLRYLGNEFLVVAKESSAGEGQESIICTKKFIFVRYLNRDDHTTLLTKCVKTCNTTKNERKEKKKNILDFNHLTFTDFTHQVS